MSTQPQAGHGLTPVQTSVVEALSRGASLSAIARSAGVHRSTIYNWVHSQPAFAAAIQEARNAYVEELRDSLRDLAGLALFGLRALLENPDTPPSVQLKAALAVLNRPHFPDPGWHLPERVDPPGWQQTLDEVASLRAETETLRTGERAAGNDPASPAPTAPGPSAAPSPSPAVPPGTPRNAPCPCGSKQKFKRCCGRSAPAQYGMAA